MYNVFCKGPLCFVAMFFVYCCIKKKVMTTSEFFAWLFIGFSFASFLFKDKSTFFKRSWEVLKVFYFVLLAILAIGFVKEQLKKK